MSFSEQITTLSQRALSLIDDLQTEESTKNALVMPFIAALGYDVFNPKEVVPEFTADVGTKKGEKVDYAIMHGGEPIILFECKKAGDSLSDANMSQLFRYFSVTHARIAVLTNGITYRFFSDLEQPNKMDNRPFLELDLLDVQDNHVSEIRKLYKDSFNLEEMLSVANELKYTGEIQRQFNDQFDEPDEEFVRFFFNKVNPNGRFVTSAREQFTGFVKTAMRQYINERVNKRLRNALQQETFVSSHDGQNADTSEPQEDGSSDDGIETTIEELEGYHIVKAIVREVVEADRIVYRDTKSYMGILLDDNNRKPICRLRFNFTQKYLGLFDENKNESKVPIQTLSDIYKYASHLKETALQYEGVKN